VRAIVDEALAKYDADKTGLVDYALESSGKPIIDTEFEAFVVSVPCKVCTLKNEVNCSGFFFPPFSFLSPPPQPLGKNGNYFI
jgi:hypothetical protein